MTARVKVCLSVALLLAILKFGVAPYYEWRGRAVEEIGVLKKSVARKKALVGNEQRVEKLVSQAKSAYGETARLYYQGFSDAQSLQLMLQKEMERLSSSSGVKILSTNWLHPSEGKIVQAPVKIRCQATPARIMKFISSIENAGHFLSVDILKILSSGRDPFVKVEIDISAYGFKDKD